MCSRICSSRAVRLSALGIRQWLHSSSRTGSNTKYASTQYGSPPNSSLATVTSLNWSLRRETQRSPPASRGILPDRRSFTSLPEPSTTTRLSVEGGVMTISLPLPGLPGLTAVRVPVDVPVREFVDELMALDTSLTRVDVANADGNKVAACTLMQDVAIRGLLISLGGRPSIRVVSEGLGERATVVPEPAAYSRVKAEVVRAGRVTLTRAGLDALFAKVYRQTDLDEDSVTLDPILADGWLRCLVEDGLVFTADKGKVVLLNPSGRGVSEEIANALRRDDELIDLKVSGLRQQLNVLHSEDARLQAIRDSLIAKANRTVTLKKGAVFAFMTAQFGVLAYCVYEVYSWDVMEPFTYFLMLSYSVGSSLYFSTKNREASFGNLKEVALKKSEAKLKSAHGYSRTSHEALKREIKRYQDAIKLLGSHRDAHPPIERFFTAESPAKLAAS